MKEKKPLFKVGDVITFDDANKLKQQYFDRASIEAGRDISKDYSEAYDDFDHTKHERLKRKYKKEIKFKIVELPEK